MAVRKWIQHAVKRMKKKGTEGSLHRALGVPQGEKISKSKLTAALHSKNPKVRKKAQFAKNVAK